MLDNWQRLAGQQAGRYGQQTLVSRYMALPIDVIVTSSLTFTTSLTRDFTIKGRLASGDEISLGSKIVSRDSLRGIAIAKLTITNMTLDRSR
jgi:hypothetical protein